MTNLLSDTWTGFDSHELRILLDAHFGGPGQYSGAKKDRNTLYLPRAGAECRVVLTFKDEREKASRTRAARNSTATSRF